MKIIRSERGFTLVEILVVIAIIALLFVMILPQINNGVVRAREAGVRTDFRSFQAASETLMRETVGKGINLNLLNSYLDNSHNVSDSGGILKTTSEDSWGTPYGVEIVANKIVFYSHGKEENTANKSYIMATYYNTGSVASCTTGFDTSNINLPFANLPSDFECGSDLVAGSGAPVVDPSTDETVALPTEKNGSCYVIRTIGQLQAMKDDLNGCYELGNNIDASSTTSWNGGLGFDPIGNDTIQFRGKFDGKSFNISNLYINRPTENDNGLFGRSFVVVFKNINLINVNITGNEYTGGLSGIVLKGHIENVFVSGNVSGITKIGGLVGYNTGDSISKGILKKSYSNVNVSGSYYIGGLVGDSTYGNIEDSYSTGIVTGQQHSIGGLVGYTQEAYIKNSFSLSIVVGGTFDIGGLIGDIYLQTVTNSYYNKETSGQNDSGKGIGKTTVEMKNQSTYVGWDFTNIWRISPVINNGYPYLQNNPPN